MTPLTLRIEGMSCSHCLAAVQKSLTSLAGVRVERVQLGRATLQYDPDVVDPARIVAAVAAAGYPATSA